MVIQGNTKGAVHSICNSKCDVLIGIPTDFHNGSYYDYHCIIKELGEEFQGKITCLGENTEKYINFSVPLRIDEKWKQITNATSCRL